MAARVILLCFGATMLIVAIRRLGAYRLKERYMLLFTFFGLPFLVLAVWPTGVGWVAEKLDIQYQTVSILCLTAFLIIMVVELLTIVSVQDRRISTLSQIVGIMMEQQGMGDRAGNETQLPGDKPK
jgi:small-conductance mechanosensitive channel